MLNNVTELAQTLLQREKHFFTEVHPLNKNVPFLDGYIYLGVFFGYLLMCLMGKLYIESFSLKLRNLLRVYNILQILANAFIFLSTGYSIATRFRQQPTFCMGMNKNAYTWDDRIEAATTSFFYFSRIFDLCDTIFIILKGKNNQLSFLHVYHHAWVLFVFWKGARYLPGAQGMWLMFLNSGVHFVMYSYYLLATFPQIASYLWWKRYITQLQIVQLLGIILGCLLPMPSIIRGECNYSFLYCLEGVIFCSLLVVSFVNFHIRSYGKSNKKVD